MITAQRSSAAVLTPSSPTGGVATGERPVARGPVPVNVLAGVPTPSLNRHATHSHLEVQLAGIWAELLKLPQVGLHDDFFDMGGDSLLATEMFHRVEQDCGCRVDPGRVLTGLTIRRLAAEILDGSRATFANPVVQVQAGDGRPPFFFLHNDAVSGGFYCRRIARGLGPDVTMFAVQPHGLNGSAFRDSIEEMAAERVDGILQVKSAGPYRIGGFCGGGVVAYEVARQLIARGHRVERLLLIDTIAPSLDLRSSWRLIRGAGSLLRVPPATQRSLFRRVKWYHEDLKASGRTGLTGAARLLGAKLKAKWEPATVPVPESSATPEPIAEELRTVIWRQFHQRNSVYVPHEFPGRLILFRSSYLDSERARGTAERWQRLSDGLEQHPIPGDHFTCVTTHAAVLAASMRPYLQG